MTSTARQYLTPLTLAALCLLGWVWSEAWQWNRLLMANDAVLPNEYWRIVSSQFAHQSGSHLMGNLAAIGLVAWVAPPWLNRWTGLIVAAYLVAGVGLIAWFSQPDVVIYRGFSGVGHGWLLIAFAWTPFLGPWFRLLLLALIYSKVIWEGTELYVIAQSWGYFNDLHVLTDMHWYGVLLALPLAVAAFVARFMRDRAPSSG